MAEQSVESAVDRINALVESLDAPLLYRKMHGIVNALAMQVEDGRYDRHAVARLGEALLATAGSCHVPDAAAERLEALVVTMIEAAEGSR
jgi:hypothetical protein